MKAPTIIAKIRGSQLISVDAITAYATLKEGDGIMTQREPDNPVDPNAILLEVACDRCPGHVCGYVDRDSAAVLAPWIDKGWLYTGVIVREPHITRLLFITEVWPTPEAEVKLTPVQPLTLKKKVKDYAPV